MSVNRSHNMHIVIIYHIAIAYNKYLCMHTGIDIWNIPIFDKFNFCEKKNNNIDNTTCNIILTVSTLMTLIKICLFICLKHSCSYFIFSFVSDECKVFVGGDVLHIKHVKFISTAHSASKKNHLQKLNCFFPEKKKKKNQNKNKK